MRKSMAGIDATADDWRATAETAAQHAALDESAARGFNARPSPRRRSDIQIHG
jgi:hypothetical protein